MRYAYIRKSRRKIRVLGKGVFGSLKFKEDFVFRTSLDVGDHPGQIFVSHNWVVWTMNGERKYVGTLPRKYYSAHLGGVSHPIYVIQRLETGEEPEKFHPIY